MSAVTAPENSAIIAHFCARSLTFVRLWLLRFIGYPLVELGLKEKRTGAISTGARPCFGAELSAAQTQCTLALPFCFGLKNAKSA